MTPPDDTQPADAPTAPEPAAAPAQVAPTTAAGVAEPPVADGDALPAPPTPAAVPVPAAPYRLPGFFAFASYAQELWEPIGKKTSACVTCGRSIWKGYFVQMPTVITGVTDVGIVCWRCRLALLKKQLLR